MVLHLLVCMWAQLNCHHAKSVVLDFLAVSSVVFVGGGSIIILCVVAILVCMLLLHSQHAFVNIDIGGGER